MFYQCIIVCLNVTELGMCVIVNIVLSFYFNGVSFGTNSGRLLLLF